MSTGTRYSDETKAEIVEAWLAAEHPDDQQQLAKKHKLKLGTIQKWVRIRGRRKGKKARRKARNDAASASRSHDAIYYLRRILTLTREHTGSATGVNDFDILGAYAIQALAALERVA